MCQGLYRRLVNAIANEIIPISLSDHGESKGDILIFGIKINFFINSVKIHYEMIKNLVYLDNNNI